MFLSHGGRPAKGNGRKRKGVDEYAAENRIDFTSRSIIRDGQLVRILVCRFCCQSIGARSDRIKEHLASKRHQKLKLEAFKEAAEAGRDLTQEYSEDGVTPLLPEPPITMLKFPGKALAHPLDSDGRHSTREMTPENEDMKHVVPNLQPMKEHWMNSSPPQSGHGLHGGIGGTNALDRSHNGSPPPQPTSKESSPQQLLCVRWGNFDSNIVSMFSKLRSQEHFVDATLWCEGKTIKCHKMILSACSTYFEKLLTEHPNPHPIIFLKDMRYWEISALVEFMYKGEVSIHQEKLQSLLRAAESLQIKGLGSPSNDIGNGIDEGTNQSGGEDDLSNSTMEMSNSSNLGNLSGSFNAFNALQSQNGLHQSSIHGGVSNSSMIDRPFLGNSIQNDNNNNTSVGPAMTHQGLLSQSLNMGMDLSNHGNNGTGNAQGSGYISCGGSPQGYAGAAKRRKKETPRRLDVPRGNLPPLTAYNSNSNNGTNNGNNSDSNKDAANDEDSTNNGVNSLPNHNNSNNANSSHPSNMSGDDIGDEEDAASEDSMTNHERNNVEAKMERENATDTEQTFEEDEEGGASESFGDGENSMPQIKSLHSLIVEGLRVKVHPGSEGPGGMKESLLEQSLKNTSDVS